MTAGLFFVAALGFGAAADGLAVGDFGSLEGDFGVVAALEPGDDDLDVRLAGSGDEELVGLGVAEEADHEVFFHELWRAGASLSSSARDLGSMA